jgi:drug/metabolite transporter (DMT)-like permease
LDKESPTGLKADLLLLITAAIWGFAFVAQRAGMASMGPFTFNAIRFSLGALILLPIAKILGRKGNYSLKSALKSYRLPILLTGLVLFGGASLQQVGLVGTTAGKAGFITGLYVIIVPLLALLWGSRTHPAHWIGAILAVGGLYLLSVKAGFRVSSYDLVVLAGAFVWAVHVHLIDRYSARVGPIRLSIFQFAICGILSGVAAILFEDISISGITEGLWPILYGGFLSVGLAYTLQVVAQRDANPSHAVIILSLEGAFAAVGGWLVLDEVLTQRDLIGSVLILGGMLVSQFFARQTEQGEISGDCDQPGHS